MEAGKSPLRARSVGGSFSRGGESLCRRVPDAGRVLAGLADHPHALHEHQQQPRQRPRIAPFGQLALGSGAGEGRGERRLQPVPAGLDTPGRDPVVRSQLDRGVGDETAAPQVVAGGLLREARHHRTDRGERGPRLGQLFHQGRVAELAVPFQRPDEQPVLAAERPVDAGAGDAEVLDEVGHRRRLVAAPPEQLQGRLQRGVRIEFLGPGHENDATCIQNDRSRTFGPEPWAQTSRRSRSRRRPSPFVSTVPSGRHPSRA